MQGEQSGPGNQRRARERLNVKSRARERSSALIPRGRQGILQHLLGVPSRCAICGLNVSKSLYVLPQLSIEGDHGPPLWRE
jgi:hypothetical protein